MNVQSPINVIQKTAVKIFSSKKNCLYLISEYTKVISHIMTLQK